MQQPFSELSVGEKAIYLHDWFHADISAFLEFANARARDLHDNLEFNRALWDRATRFYDFDYWASAASTMRNSILSNYYPLAKDRELFAKLLFTNPAFEFTRSCLYDFAYSEPQRPKLQEAVKLFFH